MSSTLRSAFITLILAATLAPDATAQRSAGSATSRPGWLRRDVSIGGGITVAQRATAVARLEQLERILQQVPELARPDGFEIHPSLQGGARRLGLGGSERKDYVVEYVLSLTFFVPSLAVSHEGCACIEIRVNHHAGSDGWRDEQGREIFMEEPRGKSMSLATQTYAGLPEEGPGHVNVLFTTGGIAPWRQATREEYYNAVILDREGKDGAKAASELRTVAKSPLDEWLAGAEERKANRELALRAAASSQSAAEVAKMRKELEDVERGVTEQLRAAESEDRARRADAVAAGKATSASLHNELTAMTAEERRMPALINTTDDTGPNATGYRLAGRDSPTAIRLLTPDYDFWRARRSPVEARTILVTISIAGSGNQPDVRRALVETFRKLDWAAIQKLLDPP